MIDLDLMCNKCPYYSCHDTLDGDCSETCNVSANTEVQMAWFCFMPNFIKKIVSKYYWRREIKRWQKFNDNERRE